MITSALLYILGSILNAFFFIFSAISYAVPDEIESSITFLLGYVNIFSGVFPLDTLYSVILAYLSFITLFYGLKVALWVFAHIPFIGSGRKFPSVSSKAGKQ